MFRGTFEHSLDEKGRIAIPSRFRESLCSGSDNPYVVITNFDRCLAAYSLKEWEELERRLAGLPQFDPQVMAFIRYFVSAATECQIDKAGRVLIPSNLRDFAGINQQCIIAGQLTKFEIWAQERWNDSHVQLSDQFLPLARSMAERGIRL